MMISRFLASCFLTTGLLAASAPAWAHAPQARVAVLARGLNISHWFRFPASNDAAALCCDLDDKAIASLRRAGFTFVRLPVGPEEVMQGEHILPAKRAAIVSAIGRLERAGLAVLIDPNPERVENWQLDRNPEARAKLLGFWSDLAPALRQLPARLTFPELVNEPLATPAHWDALQRELLGVVRTSLPDDTVILTGTDWSSLNGLLAIRPVPDRNVVYSFHSYEPQLLTLLGNWDPAIRRDQLAPVLLFPVPAVADCRDHVAPVADAHTRAMAESWCSMHQDAESIMHHLARAAAWGQHYNVSVAMTEFGAMARLNGAARANYLAAMRVAAERLELPWGLWALDDQMGFDQQPGGYHRLRQLPPPVLQAAWAFMGK